MTSEVSSVGQSVEGGKKTMICPVGRKNPYVAALGGSMFNVHGGCIDDEKSLQFSRTRLVPAWFSGRKLCGSGIHEACSVARNYPSEPSGSS